MNEEKNVKNIVIIGANLPFVNAVAKQLADQLEMFYLDLQGLFEFDISPETFSDLLKQGGEKYFRSRQRGSVKYASSFENTVIAIELGVAESLDNIEILDKRGLLILLESDFKSTAKQLKQVHFASRREKELFVVSKKEFERRVKNVQQEVDITINAQDANLEKVVDEINEKILEYYSE